MKIIKINEEIIDIDICNQNTQQENLHYILKNCFDNNILNEKEKEIHLSYLVLIPHVKIEELISYSNIKFIKIKTGLKGKARSVLFFYDENGKCINDNFIIKCNKCGKVFKTKKCYTTMHKKNLLCKSCSCHYTQILGGQKKFEETMMKKYGCRRPIQNKKIKIKTQKTMMKKYGANSPLESSFIKNKIINTMIKKYGVENPFHSSIFQQKCKKSYINHSIKGDNLMEKLSQDLPYKLLYGDNEKLFTFKNHWYRVDGFIEEKNFAIQFQGDYYHANPSIYDENHIFNNWGKQKTAKQIWEKDKKRKNELETIYGIKIFYVWEKDLKEKGYSFILNQIKKVLGL